jgi:hypothetical protein
VCTPEGQALDTAQLLVFQPPQAQAGKAGRGKASVSGTDRDMTPLVVGMMHDTSAIQFRVVGARALGQLAAALQSHAGGLVCMSCLPASVQCDSLRLMQALYAPNLMLLP